MGDSGVGRSNLFQRFIEGDFSPNRQTTTSIEVGVRTLTVGEAKVRVQMWDTALQARYSPLMRAYYGGAVGVVLVYDVTNRASFEGIKAWLGEIRKYAEEGIVIILAGNKCDMAHMRAVSAEEGAAFAKENGLLFAEVSARDGTGVNGALEAVLSMRCQMIPEEARTSSSGTPAQCKKPSSPKRYYSPHIRRI